MSELVLLTIVLTGVCIACLANLVLVRKFSTNVLSTIGFYCEINESQAPFLKMCARYMEQVAVIRDSIEQQIALNSVFVILNILAAVWTYTYQQIPLLLQVLCSFGTALAFVGFLNSQHTFRSLQMTLQTVIEKSDHT